MNMFKPMPEQQLVRQLSDQRRAIAAQSPQHFAEIYLARHLQCEPPAFHREIYQMLHRSTQKRRARIALAAPRGSTKSTVVCLAYVLWSVLYEHEKFVLIISATGDQAKQLLRHVKDEVQSNPRLLADFPDVCHPPGAKARPKPWRDEQIRLSSGVLVRAAGAGTHIRGTRNGPHRPDLVVVDDLENQEHCETAEQRHKLRDWFDKTLLKIGDDRTNFIVVGTILHYDALLANLTHEIPAQGRSVGWERRKYQAVLSFSERSDLWEQWEAIRFNRKRHEDEAGPVACRRFFEANREDMLAGTDVLWPQRESYYDLMEMRADEGVMSFQTEKQNEPLDPERCMFSANRIHYWDDEFDNIKELLSAIGPKHRFYGACDPSMGNRGHRGDYTAIITLVHDRKANITYVIDADLARRKPDQTIDRIIAMAKAYRYTSFAFEANQFQDVMAEELRKRALIAGAALHPKKITSTTHKESRIESLEPLISSGRLRFHRSQTTLLEQLRQFPLGAHDDGPDALEMAVSEAMIPPVTWGRTIGLN